MRGCALPFTKLAPPPHLCSAINSSSFPIAPIHSLTIFHTPKPKLFTLVNANAEFSSSSASTSVANKQQQEEEEDEDDEESYQVLTAMKSDYNDILIVDTPKSRMLLLDSTHNVHSILYKEQKWTGSYWDEFASLPAIVPNPKGPIAILGLGGGTAAHLMLDLWPSLQLEGWEIDEIALHFASC